MFLVTLSILSLATTLDASTPSRTEVPEPGKCALLDPTVIQCMAAPLPEVIRAINASSRWSLTLGSLPEWSCRIDDSFSVHERGSLLGFLKHWGLELSAEESGLREEVSATEVCRDYGDRSKNACAWGYWPHSGYWIRCDAAGLSTIAGAINQWSEWQLIVSPNIANREYIVQTEADARRMGVVLKSEGYRVIELPEKKQVRVYLAEPLGAR